ncbi:MAG: ATP-binding protein [Bacteroidetes bacterium]|nr:ATP-binding protein [Bacteroidota bacterium]
MKIVRIIGGESTGKSALSKDLQEHFGGILVEEQARNYLHDLQRPYEKKDVVEIAHQQVSQENKAIQTNAPWVFCDTDLHVIQVWMEFKYADCPREFLDHLAIQRTDIFLLCSPDLAWEDDPLREHPTLEDRHFFYAWYLHLISSQSTPHFIVRGQGAERTHSAITFLNKMGSTR